MTVPFDPLTIAVAVVVLILALAVFKKLLGLVVRIAFLVALAFLVLKGSQWAMENLWIPP